MIDIQQLSPRHEPRSTYFGLEIRVAQLLLKLRVVYIKYLTSGFFNFYFLNKETRSTLKRLYWELDCIHAPLVVNIQWFLVLTSYDHKSWIVGVYY